MEDKRTALAIFLCLAVVILYSNLVLAPRMRPTPPAPAAAPASSGQALQLVAPGQPVVAQQPLAQGQMGAAGTPAVALPVATVPTPAELEAGGHTIVRSANFEIEFAHLGGRIRHFRLLHYKDHQGADTPLDLVTSSETSPLPLGVRYGLTAFSDVRVPYSVSVVSGPASKAAGEWWLPADQEMVLVLQGALPGGQSIEKRITLRGSSYLFKVDVLTSQPQIDGSNLWLEWSQFIPTDVAKRRLDAQDFLILNDSQRIVHVKSADFAPGVIDQGSNSWAGFGNLYFMSVVVPAVKGTPNVRLAREGDVYSVRAASTPVGGSFEIYVGPKDSRILGELPHLLERGIDLGMFSFLAFPLLALIRVFHDWLGNYGLAIILLTLVIKAIFLPLTQASFKSMKAMQDLQPEMKALRERIKDPAQLNQEVMALYRRRGVNPIGGCLPMLIQLPVFLGLYNALLHSIELRHSPFALWITDLSAPEALTIVGIPIPVMVLLMGASMYVQQATTPPVGDPQQQKIMKMMPIIFTLMFIIFPMPSGLVLYWFVSNIISITQQIYLKRATKAAPIYATAVASVLIFGFGFVLSLLPRWS